MTTEKIGRYEIKSELGRGGMATVFHAYDPSFERDVAIKVLPQAFLHDPQFRVRFQREAKMIALLEHPAIVPVYDFGEDHEQPYIVMRYMAGGSLADRIKTGAISAEETARIFMRLAPALDAAHARGIIHRDLKPGNILFDQYGNAFLSDFGIARLVAEGSATLTGGNILGTPAYMSPEQVQGDKNIDGRSDIYALGVLVYQMLSGHIPYRADTPAKVMMMHVLEPVPHIMSVKKDLPAGIDTVLSIAMAKSPEERYSTAGEMAAALEAAVRGELPTRYLQAVGKNQEQSTLTLDATVVRTGPVSTPTPSTPPPVSPVPGAKTSKPRPRYMVVAIPLLLVACLGILAIGGALAGGPAAIMAMLAPASQTPTLAAPTRTQAVPSPTTGQETPVLPATQAVIAAASETPPANTDTPEPPTSTFTPEPSPTATEPPKPPVIGGADKIAFINNNDIFVANLDGTDIRQLTQDHALKANLQWSPDGKSVFYLEGKCVQSVEWETGRQDTVVCFNYVQYLEEFEISPDGLKVAVSLDRELYVVPFDLERLGQVRVRSDLSAMGDCEHFAPYRKNELTVKVKEVHWSFDSQTLALKVMVPLSDGRLSDNMTLIPIDRCIPNPLTLDNFPSPRFHNDMKNYLSNPFIQNFSWDGYSLFVLTNQVRNDGYGDLFVYNTELHKAFLEVNPVENSCCYRDPVWSPDGSYLAFAFQNISGGSESVSQLYLIPYGSVGTGATYTPLPLFEITNPKEKPQIALRPAR